MNNAWSSETSKPNDKYWIVIRYPHIFQNQINFHTGQSARIYSTYQMGQTTEQIGKPPTKLNICTTTIVWPKARSCISWNGPHKTDYKELIKRVYSTCRVARSLHIWQSDTSDDFYGLPTIHFARQSHLNGIKWNKNFTEIRWPKIPKYV